MTVGAAYLVADLDGTTDLSEAVATFDSEGDGDCAGNAVVGANDAAGDWAADLLEGGPRYDANGNDAGVGYFLASDRPADRTTPEVTTASPTESPDATRTPSVDVPPTQIEVVSECTQVSIVADGYDAAVLTFADGTRRSFDGPFTGQRTFASENDDDVIRSLESSSKAWDSGREPHLRRLRRTMTDGRPTSESSAQPGTRFRYSRTPRVAYQKR